MPIDAPYTNRNTFPVRHRQTQEKLMNRLRVSVMGSLCCALVVAVGCGSAPERTLSPAEAQAIAKEAYLYGFPMVMNFKTMYS